MKYGAISILLKAHPIPFVAWLILQGRLMGLFTPTLLIFLPLFCSFLPVLATPSLSTVFNQ